MTMQWSGQLKNSLKENYMARIGIVGSSFSQGGDMQPIEGSDEEWELINHPFEYTLEYYNPQHQFFNAAMSGRGSERFLNNLLHLKDRYDITHLLIEIIQNRSVNYFWYKEEQYKNDLNNWTDDMVYKYSVEEDYEHLASMNKPQDYAINQSLYKDFSKKDIQTMADLSAYSLYRSAHLDLLAVRDVKNTIKLCEMIGVKPICWSFKMHTAQFAPHIFNEMIDAPDHLVSFIEKNGLSYVDNTCDGLHLNKTLQMWAAEFYFTPLFEQFV